MKRVIISIILMHTVVLSFSQKSEGMRGTLKIKKVSADQILPKGVRKKQLPRVFIMRSNRYVFKETFPMNYRSELYPLVFINGGLVLADEDKKWKNHRIIGYDYEIFIGNVSCQKARASDLNINRVIYNLDPGHYIWISGLYYMDDQENYHFNEIGEFKIERLN